MCDYSLHHVVSRPATVGDKLVTTKFVNTPTGGFAAVDNPNVAVCLRPGTELAFERDVECEPALGILPSRKIGQRLARFRQVNMEQPCVHHDALEFPGGKIVLVTRLREGQQATVLQMPAAVRGEHVAAAASGSCVSGRSSGCCPGSNRLAERGGDRSCALREPRRNAEGSRIQGQSSAARLMHNRAPRAVKCGGIDCDLRHN